MEKGFFLRYDEFNSNPEANLVADLCGYDVGYGCDRQKFIFRILVEMNRIPTNLQLNRVEGMGMARCAVVLVLEQQRAGLFIGTCCSAEQQDSNTLGIPIS